MMSSSSIFLTRKGVPSPRPEATVSAAHGAESSLRGLGAHVSLDRSEDPRPCPLLRDGPDSGRVAAARSTPCRPGAQFGGHRSGTFLDLRSHQSLRPDFGEGGPLSSGHYLHRADTHEQPSRRNFPIGRLQGALVTTPAGASDRPHSRARLDVFRFCWIPTDDNSETRARARYGRSGNKPGIQRAARVAGKTRRNGARGLSDASTPRSIKADTTRRACRSTTPAALATSPRGSSPR